MEEEEEEKKEPGFQISQSVLNWVDIPAYARTAHKGLPQKRLGRGSLLNHSSCPSNHPISQGTEVIHSPVDLCSDLLSSWTHFEYVALAVTVDVGNQQGCDSGYHHCCCPSVLVSVWIIDLIQQNQTHLHLHQPRVMLNPKKMRLHLSFCFGFCLSMNNWLFDTTEPDPSPPPPAKGHVEPEEDATAASDNTTQAQSRKKRKKKKTKLAEAELKKQQVGWRIKNQERESY